MGKYLKWLPLTVLCCVVFLSVGFSSFSANLTLSDITASVRPTKEIRITNFYTYHSANNAESLWDEYSSNVLSTNIVLPDIDSEISYKFEVTNVSNEVMMISDITGLPDDLTYEVEDYDLNNKICDGDNCKSLVKREYVLTIKYKDNATVSDESKIIKLDFVFEKYKYKIIFNANGGTGDMDDLFLEYDEMASLPSSGFRKENYRFDGWNTERDGSGESYNNEQVVQNINKNDENEITLYAQWVEASEGFYYPGYCIFNGQGHDVEGECAEGQHIDYVDTGIKLFSEENYQRSFVLSFTIKEVGDQTFTDYRSTIFNALYEIDDREHGKYPGLLLRVEGNKWMIEASKGREPDYAAKIYFNKEELLNKKLTVIRYNDGDTIKVYYMVDDEGPFLLKDITDFADPFDTTLTFGASIEDGVIYRYSVANLKDIYFEFVDDDRTLEDLTGGHVEEQIDDMVTVFSQEGSCTFHGPGSNITGEDCSLFADYDYIDTEADLFSIGNIGKDFEMYFELDGYEDGNQSENQATVMNAFLERTGTGYGILLRRLNDKLQMIMRDGNGKEKKINVNITDPLFVKIIRKNGHICYSINNGNLKYAINMNNFAAVFNVPVTFGASIDKNGNVFRNINGTMSNMYIKMGKMDDSVVCNPNM